MRKRPLTPAYLFFYILFWPDTWRILIGVILAFILAPRIARPDMGVIGSGMIWIMLASIGYAVSSALARRISESIKKLILKDKQDQVR